MKGLKPFLSLAVGLLACAIMAGCAGGIPQNGPSALNIAQFTVNNAVIGISYKFLLVASGGIKPYTWTITSGQLPPGLSLNTDGVISGTPTTLGKFSFTAKVVDSQTPVAAVNSLSASITVNQVLTLTATSLPSGLVGGIYNATITASNGLQPYTYTVTDASALPDGLTLVTTPGQNGAPNVATISGTPTTAGVYSFAVQVNDAANEVASAIFTITVVGRLQGPYVLYFNGFDNNQPFYDVGQLTAGDVNKNGQGTIAGFLDQIGPGGTAGSNVAVTGSYMIASGTNFGTLTFKRGDNQQTYNFGMIVSTHGDTKVILNNTSDATPAYGSGVLKAQSATTVSGLLTNYSFGLFGNDSGGSRYAAAGMFALGNSANGSQPVNGGEEDTNDNGTASTAAIRGGSLLQADPASGRGTYSLTTQSAATFNYVYYVVSSTELVAIDIDAPTYSTLVDVQQQQVAGTLGSFSNASLTSQALIQLNGLATSNGSLVPSAAVGVVTFDGAGNIARTDGISGYYTDESDGGVVTAVQYTSATYNVDASCGSIQQACGRVTVTLPAGAPGQVWYLVSVDQAFVVDTSPAVTSGSFQSQSVPAKGFTVGSILGSYLANTITPVLPSVTNELDVSITPPGDTWNQKYDASGPFGLVNQAFFTGGYNCGATFPSCDAFDTALGRFVITGPGKGTSDVEIVYVIGAGVGTTGIKGGLVGLNVGQQSDGTPDPNPRLTVYSK